MMRSDRTSAALQTIPPDAQLVYRVAALSDKRALAELHARHGMTLYALAYSIVFDGYAADAAVAAVFREVWRDAAAFDSRARSAGQWLAELMRRAIYDRERARLAPAPAPAPAPVRGALPAPAGAVVLAAPAHRSRDWPAWARFARVAASLVLPALL